MEQETLVIQLKPSGSGWVWTQFPYAAEKVNRDVGHNLGAELVVLVIAFIVRTKRL